uniref:ZnMc domain-containing protein n=1 Tax=Rhabditophanes sp. KR3021 TaxID=114890 RepID=A0AC35UG02_9BILA
MTASIKDDVVRFNNQLDEAIYEDILQHYQRQFTAGLPSGRCATIIGTNKNFYLNLDVAAAFSEYFRQLNSIDTIHYISRQHISDRAVGKVLLWMYSGETSFEAEEIDQVLYLCTLWKIDKLGAILKLFKKTAVQGYEEEQASIISPSTVSCPRKKKVLSIRSFDVSGLMDNKLLANPIKRFQQFSGLPVTGELDNSTLIKLNTPRCGVEDVNLDTKTKRASVNTWNKNLIKYFIKNFSTKLTDDEVRAGLSEAWNVWSVVTPLKFQEVGPSEKRDVVVRFAELSHGDAFPFDGPGGVLGHSLLVGDMLHLDNAESWKYVKTGDRILSSQIDFLNIAIHEIGHVLGLKHSPDKDSIMTPFYRTSNSLNYKKPALSDSDIRVIQSMYGVRNEITTTTPVPRPFPLGSSDTLRTYLTAFPDLAATINFSGSDGYRDSLTNFLKQYEIWYSKQT